ncbi:rhythmically expressed gene 2 protein-like isoform X2 [Adelges cooleyi]|uniref:rhythmically expressed gene 2 protein-like isoform X2 n=1 Tax=Adelges cooleyi TaxID=133065 RepID=UPI0021807622|nr:rhythmically expressed gene 2 protein-like isoform X2 [Adelges cooleyi]
MAAFALKSEMNFRSFKLITFDITGTLLKYRSSPTEEYSTVLNKHGIKVNISILEELIKRNMKDMTKLHPNFGLKTGLGWDNYWRKFAQNVISGAIPKEYASNNLKIITIVDDLMNTYSTGETFKLQNGAIDLLKYLKKKQVPLGVISNYDPRIINIINNLGIADYFLFILSSYQVGYAKPDIEIFQKAESFVCNETDRKLFLHVGDSYAFDFVGAKSAGWSACLVHTDKQIITKEHPNIADCIFNDFVEFKQFLMTNKPDKIC